MRIRKFILVIGCLIVLSGCTYSNIEDTSKEELMNDIKEQSVVIDEITKEIDILKNALSDSKRNIAILEQNNTELQSELDKFNLEIKRVSKSIDPILKTLSLSNDFIEAYVDGDLMEIESFVSDPVSINKDEIVVIYEDEIYKHDLVEEVVGYSLNGYGVVGDSVFYHYAVYKKGGVDITGIFIINLEYKQVNGLWKLIGIEFDI